VLLSVRSFLDTVRPAAGPTIVGMIRGVRSVLLILTVVLLVSIFAHVLRLDIGLPVPVVLMMAWGMLDAAAHRDSIWRAADQNKLVWVFVQLIPVIGTVAYLILVHRGLVDAEDRVTSR
jgi:hypothetical protein